MTALNKQALRVPERKRHDWSQAVMRDCDFCDQWSLTVKHENSGCICASCSDAEYTSELKYALESAIDHAESVEKRIAELEARTITVKFEPIPMEELGNRRDGKKHPYMFGAGYNSAVVHCESVLHQACAAAGIGVKGE
ncbi:hypothetical protein HV310_04175 [Citrobacter freundii]|nr:hypothetical protein [Citrobacter freundii]QMR43970.1 hypothetical protein HV310_04175 [Citrobacter freundii]